MSQDIYYPAQQLLKAIEQARARHLVIAALYSSNHCPFCIALKKEQLSPRMSSKTLPGFMVVEFDIDMRQPFTLPDGRRMTVQDWGRMHQLSLYPTLVMIDDAAMPITAPLVGYASRDFYPVYLEEAIKTAHATLTKQRSAAR